MNEPVRTEQEVDHDIGLLVRRLFQPDDTDTAADSGTMDRLKVLALEKTRAHRGKPEKKAAQEVYELLLMLIYKYKPGRWSELEHVCDRAGLEVVRKVEIG